MLTGAMGFPMVSFAEPFDFKRFVVVGMMRLDLGIAALRARQLFDKSSFDSFKRNAAHRVLFDTFRIVLTALTTAASVLTSAFAVGRIVQIRCVALVLAFTTGIKVSAFRFRFGKLTQWLLLPAFITNARRNVPRRAVLCPRLLTMKTPLNLIGASLSTSAAKMIKAVLQTFVNLKSGRWMPTITIPAVQFAAFVRWRTARTPRFISISISHNGSYCNIVPSFCQGVA